MITRILIRTAAGAAIFAAWACLGAGAVSAQTVGGGKPTHTATPIKHFITLMQENHSFDNYFGTYPGADGLPPKTCIPVRPADRDPCVRPYHIDSKAALTDIGHDHRSFQKDYDGGRMDGFVAALADQGNQNYTQAMGYYDARDIPFYWNLADNYVLFDHQFTSANTGSMANHMFWVAAARGVGRGDRIPARGLTIPTIFDRLQAAGVSWKFYVQNYDPRVTYRHQGRGNHIAQTIYVPILNLARFLDNPSLSSHIVPLSQYYNDLDHGTLPAVAYIAPSGDSEHPPSNIASGERFVHVLLGALMRSSAWDTSAFMLSYDDWGGWYDHVKPPRVDAYGYGFRSPALLVSPYAKRGFVDHTVLDFTSQVKFIEQNWGLKPLARRDAAARGLVSAFDFSKTARRAVMLGFERHPPPPVHPRAGVVYLAYGGAIGAFAAAVGVAAARRRWPLLNGREASSGGLGS